MKLQLLKCGDCGKEWRDFATDMAMVLIKASGDPVICDQCASIREAKAARKERVRGEVVCDKRWLSDMKILMTTIFGVYGAMDYEVWSADNNRITSYRNTYIDDIIYHFEDKPDLPKISFGELLEEIRDMAQLEANETMASFGRQAADKNYARFMRVFDAISSK